ncbi:HTH-type transcriptional repressor YtrA [Actinomyces naeslundii]|jgi:transcriptional regulator, GntR family|uniref:GntR family transcriptional regulator n=1 Tax=Actinomyces TaxID=1654 RepID=UPI00094DAA9A|nr:MULTISPECIES: GntR family transcriptional regulator [Actinomyces]OLO78178.1 GntR family transcriptional regulator [Actinomyces oris]VTX69710.1 HTH-type transcriptional repressor YtrA [Actinomyces naeslundii]
MDLDDSRPIWIQLVDDFRMRIVTGIWPAGTRIPSVRDLATQAGVNPNTVQRALAELDRSGLTVTERTAGRFVTADAAVLDAVRRELAVGATDTFIAAVTAIGMDLAQAGETLAEQWPASTTDESGEPS